MCIGHRKSKGLIVLGIEYPGLESGAGPMPLNLREKVVLSNPYEFLV